MNEREEEILELIQKPQAIRERLETLGVELADGTTSARYDAGDTLNLNAIAIGLGLRDVIYQPGEFLGLIYRVDNPNVTVVIAGTGEMVITDAANEITALEAFEKTIDTLEMLFGSTDEIDIDSSIEESEVHIGAVEAGETNPKGPLTPEL